MRRAFWLALGLLSGPAWTQGDVGRNLVVNGDFAADADGNGLPDGFSGDRSVVALLVEDGNPFLRLERTTVGTASVGQRLRLDPDWFKLRVSVRVRFEDVKQGQEGWHDCRIAMSFHNAAGEQVGGWPNVLHWTGTSRGWEPFERDYVIPEGAVELWISLSMFSTTGRADFDDFAVTVLSHRPRPEDAALPPGVIADWSLANAARWDNGRRGEVCLNGLWRFFPVTTDAEREARPADGTGWGYLKVPAAWPGRNVDAMTPIGPDIWELRVDWRTVEVGWYERTVTVPENWAGRRLFLAFDMPQTEAEVWLDGQAAGSVRWPAGRVDVSSLLKPGATATITVRVTTDPFEKERMVAMREDLIEQVKAQVIFRGLVGDVTLESEPPGPRLLSVQTRPSVRDQTLGLAVGVDGLAPGAGYVIEAVATRDGREEWRATSAPFTAAEVRGGRYECRLAWPNPALWSFERPQLYDLNVSLRPAGGGDLLDARPTRFGFRELWLDGRNLMLNGRPLHLRALDFSNTTHNVGQSSAAGVRVTLERMRRLGFNFVILSNYGLDPGATAAFGDLLRTADEMGFGLSFSGPHAFRSQNNQPEMEEAWKRVAAYAVQTAGNHPSVLAYALNHNTLGYPGDQNPLKIDGFSEFRPAEGDTNWYARNWDQRRARAAASEAYFRGLDPTREVYHHQSGLCGAWHTVNIYLNWAPIQERSEWLRHWATEGTRPVFFVEWGLPHIASWGGHRQGPFIWRNRVNSEPLGVEYGAMLTGEHAYAITPAIERYVDNYERVYARREPFHITQVFWSLWDTDNELNNIELQSLYADVNWPRLRTWGITAILPWDQGRVGYPQGGTRPQPLPTDWTALQRPGYAPDVLPADSDYFRGPEADWRLTSLGRVFARWNQPVVAYLAGEPANFAELSHNVSAGERLTKQIILLNDSESVVEGTYLWRLSLGKAPVDSGEGPIQAEAGGQVRVPFTATVPAEAPAGELTLSIRVQAGRDEWVDELTLHVVEPAETKSAETALFDPVGKTAAELARLGLRPTTVGAEDPLDGVRSLLIGREAVGLNNALPDLTAVLARGGRVLVMEQTEEALTHRLGFRVNDPSLRNVFVRVPGHPVLAGLDDARLRDWRGESTLTPPYLDLPPAETGDPPHDWLGFRNTRVWKCGNTGQVATVVIEKPQRGDYTALVDGGFDLQYAPLLLAREGAGEVLFCQMDVTGRTASDPAADRLLRNLLRWLSETPAERQSLPTRYVGDADSAALLASLGVEVESVSPERAAGPGLLVVGRHAGALLQDRREAITAALRDGMTVFCLPQRQEDLTGWLPFQVICREAARLDASINEAARAPGIGPSELHWRGRKSVLEVGAGGAEPTVVHRVPVGRGAVVFCQIAPDDWDYADEYRVYLKRTHNRTAVLLTRLLAAAGATFRTTLTSAWATPVPPTVDLAGTWQAAADPGGQATPETAASLADWHELQAPATFESQVDSLKDYDGAVWYRRTFEWRGPTDREVRLRLGAIDDEDWTWLNGRLVGHIGRDTHPDNYWSAERIYTVPPGTLRAGENTLAVKVVDLRQSGGIVRGPLDLGLPARWLDSYYLDTPAALDDPYRYNRW